MPLFSHSPKPESGEAMPDANAMATHPARGTIGELLRETRQSYGGDVAQIAGTLRIRAAYLTAIEESRYDGLPAPVYALGFVRAYANHLGLDGDEAVRRFKQETVDFESPRGLSFPVPLAERSIPGGTMLLAALILAFCGYGLWYYVSTGERARPERVAAVPAELAKAIAPSVSPAPAPPPATTTQAAAPDNAAPVASAPAEAVSTPSPPATPVAPASPAASAGPPAGPLAPVVAPAQPTAAPSFPPPGVTILPHPPATAETPASPPNDTARSAAAASQPDASATAAPADQGRVYGAVDAPSRIVIHARKESWIQIRDGEKIVAGRILHPGDSFRVPDRTGLVMDTGNGAGLDIEVDGVAAPSLGAAVRHNVMLEPGRLAAGTAIMDQSSGTKIH